MTFKEKKGYLPTLFPGELFNISNYYFNTFEKVKFFRNKHITVFYVYENATVKSRSFGIHCDVLNMSLSPLKGLNRNERFCSSKGSDKEIYLHM